MGFLARTSALGIGVAGALIFACWIVAAKDKFVSKPGGCIQKFHDNISSFDGLKSYYKRNQDAYPVLISFGIICGSFWIITAILSFISPVYYLALGIFTTIMFICSFVPLVEILRQNRQCENYKIIAASLGEPDIFAGKDNADVVKNIKNSYEIFWGSSIACFILAAYQIGCAIVMVYDSSTQKKSTVRLDTERPLEEQPQASNLPEPPDANLNNQSGEANEGDKNNKPEEDKTVNPTPDKTKVAVNREEPERAVERFLDRPAEQQPYSVYVKKGERELPKESPLPEISNAEFTLNDF